MLGQQNDLSENLTLQDLLKEFWPRQFFQAWYLKHASAILIKFFRRMIALQKLKKMLFISSKELFSLSRYSFFCISVLPSFSTCRPLLRGWSKINLKLHEVINCLSKISRTHFVWYLEKEKTYDIETLSIDGVSDEEQRKIMQKIGSKS